MSVFKTISNGYTKSFQLPDFTRIDTVTVNGLSVDYTTVGNNVSIENVGSNGQTIIIKYQAANSLEGVIESAIAGQILPQTKTGIYIGNGTTQSVNLGFKPDFVIIKANAGRAAIWANDLNFFRRNDYFINSSSLDGQFGITLTSTGFTVGNDNVVNANTETFYYFAYTDNETKSMLQGNWQGNLATGRTVDIFKGVPLQGAIIKRDNGQPTVWCASDKTGCYFFNGSGNVVSNGTSINGDTGVLTLGAGDEVNQWAGILGEGTNCLAFPKNSKSTAVKVFTGTGAARKVTLPFVPDFFMVIPRNATSGASRAWISSAPNVLFSLSTSAPGTGDFTVTGGTINFTGAGQNELNREYVIYAWKKLRNNYASHIEDTLPVIKNTVEINPTGYIDCGTSNTLAVNGDLTMEWFGALYNNNVTQYTASPTVDTDAGNQAKIQPLIFRSNGADGTSAVNYGMAVTAPPVSTDQWNGAVLMVCTHDRWQMLKDTSGNLDNNPMNTGYLLDTGVYYHIVATHSGNGVWNVYVNGVNVKERKRDMAAAIGRPNVVALANQRLVIGGRQRTTIDNTNGMSFKLARIYSRALTANEVESNFNAILGLNPPASDFTEEWSADNSTTTTVLAKINPVNNGTIVNASLVI